ncbi:MAG: LmeA family phospholipid-binding protein [Candidatus Sericytochromatia bacterium]|nr:LmeA family phospholipid-binding protein [Candidatus Sericytochromatia bacterium]
MSWIAAVGVIVVLATGSAAPGQVAEGLERELERRWGAASCPHAEVLADPFLDLTRGRLRALRIEAREVPVGAVRLPRVCFDAEDVRVPGHALYGMGPPVLLDPARARVRIEATGAELTAEAARLQALGALEGLSVPAGPLATLLGSHLAFTDVRVDTLAGRVRLEARLKLGDRTGRSLAVSFTPVLDSAHRSIRGTGWQATLGQRPVPSALLRLAGRLLPPLVALDRLPLPGPGWRFERLQVSPQGLLVEAAGTLAPGGP